MKPAPLLWASLLLPLASNSHAAPAPPSAIPNKASTKIRVSLGYITHISISGYDLLINGSTRLPENSAFNIRCGTEETGADYVEFGGGRRAIGKLEITAPEGILELNSKPYRSNITIIPKGNQCLVVNVLDLEKYLAGLITKEMSPSWPIEALKAHAVAARSYALFQMQTNRTREFDLENSTQDQVYDGAASETARSIEAIELTRGQVLTYFGSPLKAYFHANCGGKTEVPDFVWGGEVKAFRTVMCPYHRKEKDKQLWKVHLTRPQIEHALRKITGLLPRTFLRLATLEAGAPNASQRLSDVMVSDAEGNSFIVSSNAFRNAIGNTKLKSTAFRIERERDGYILHGEGFGHGVGLCQIGARGMAKEGRTFRQILAFYYPLAKIRSL